MKSTFYRLFLVLCFIFSLNCAPTESVLVDFDTHWKDLFFTQKNPEQTKTFCSRWLMSSEVALKVNAHACLASLAVYEKKDAGFEDALSEVEKALALDPHDFNTHLLRIHLDLYYKKSLSDSVLKSLTVLPDISLEQWLEPLQAWFEMQEYQGVFDYLLALESKFKDNAALLSRLGLISLYLEKLDVAQSYLNQALALNPNDLSAIISLAQIAVHEKDFKKAQTLFEDSFDIAPPESPSFKIVHCLYSQFLKGSLDDSAKACAHAQNTCPDFYSQNCGE